MTEQQATVERMFEEIINQGDLAVADELFDADFVDHGPLGDVPGVEAFKQLVTMWRAACPDVHCTVENWLQDGDLAAWNVRVQGTHTGDFMGIPASGRSFEYVSPNIGRVTEDNRAIEHWSDQGMFQFLTQIGALPVPAG